MLNLISPFVFVFHMSLFFSENITESHKFGLFSRSWRSFLLVVINDNWGRVWVFPESVCHVNLVWIFFRAEDFSSVNMLLEQLITRQIILWRLVMLYSDSKQRNVWGPKYYFVKILPKMSNGKFDFYKKILKIPSTWFQ